jgi:protein-disulfide isomerase
MPEDRASDQENQEQEQEQTRRLVEPISDDDHTLGEETASVHIVEFGDYECQACRLVHEHVDEVLSERGDDVWFAFRHFPLTNIHPYALGASVAADAAERQDRFWEMHGTLFESDGNLEIHEIIGYAQDLGLDIGQFAADVADREMRRTILHRRMQGLKSGVEGTPTFFINSLRWDGEPSVENLSAAIDLALEHCDED